MVTILAAVRRRLPWRRRRPAVTVPTVNEGDLLIVSVTTPAGTTVRTRPVVDSDDLRWWLIDTERAPWR